MITFDTLGGHGQLGNQMFQYALLLGVKSKSNQNIFFSESVKNKSYLFDFFNLCEYTLNDFNTSEYREKHFHFDLDVFDVKDNISFFGLFQSEKYFKHCSDLVRQEFTFKQHILEKTYAILEPFKNYNLVSVHIRRGDYLNYPDLFPLPSLDYYKQGFKEFNSKDTYFICTSNDIEWCMNNFDLPNIFYSTNSLEIDLCLQSLCNYHIISNSTFSWWGSWLGSDKNKKIIAPKIWFGSGYSYYNTKDLYRDEFILL
jgi:hypothetical protein